MTAIKLGFTPAPSAMGGSAMRRLPAPSAMGASAMRRLLGWLAGGALGALALLLASAPALAQNTYTPTSMVRLNGVTYEGTQGATGSMLKWTSTSTIAAEAVTDVGNDRLLIRNSDHLGTNTTTTFSGYTITVGGTEFPIFTSALASFVPVNVPTTMSVIPSSGTSNALQLSVSGAYPLPGPITVSIRASVATITEGQNMSFTLTASENAPAGGLTVRVRREELGPGDYVNAETTLTRVIGAGDSTVNFTTATEDKMGMEPNSVFVATILSGGVGFVVGTPSAASVTITPTPPASPTIDLGVVDDSRAESAGAAFTIRANPALTAPGFVGVRIDQSGNFVARANLGIRQFILPTGTSFYTFTVATVDDFTDEEDGSVTVNLTTTLPFGYTNGVSSAMVTVTDNDGTPFVDYDDSIPLRQVETGGNMVFAFRIFGNTGGSAPGAGESITEKTITVDYATSDGTAIKGTDYTTTTGTLTFMPGQARARLSVPIQADADSTADTFTMTITNPDNAQFFTVGATALTRTATIVESPEVSILNTRDTMLESDDMVFNIVTRGITAAFTATVNVSEQAINTTGGTALAAGEAGDKEVVIPAGQEETPFTVQIDDDMLDEGDNAPIIIVGGRNREVISLIHATLVSVPTAYTIAASDSSASTFVGDDDQVVATVADESAGEDAGVMVFTVNLSVESTKQITVNYAVDSNSLIRDDTAEAADFTFTTDAVLNFAPGDRNKQVTVSIFADAEDEDDVFSFLLTSISDSTLNRIGTSRAKGTILDLPAVNVVATDADMSIVEGEDAIFRVQVGRAPTSALNVPLRVSQTGRVAVSLANRTVQIPAGSTSALVTIATDDDNTDEDDGVLSLHVGSGLPATYAAGSSGMVTVTDNEDVPALRLPISAAAPDVADNAVVTITLAPASGAARGPVSDKEVSVEVETTAGGGTAVAGVDYTAIPATRLTFPPRSNALRVTIDIIAPDADEDVDNFYLEVRSPTNAFISGGACTLCIQVQLLEKPTLGIVRHPDTPASIMENEAALFIISLSEAQSAPVPVPVTAVETGNVLGAVPPTVTLDAGATSATLNLPLDNDNRDEEDSSITLTIAVPEGSGDTYAIAPARATLQVMDDDDQPVVRHSPVEAVEGRTLAFRLTLDPASEKTARVSYELEAASGAGMATAGEDYVAVPAGVLTFQPGETQKFVRVETLRDRVQDPDETLTLLLMPPMGEEANASIQGYEGGTEGQPMPARVVGTIQEGLTDDEKQLLNQAILPQVSLAMATQTSRALRGRVQSAFDRPAAGAAPGLSLNGQTALGYVRGLLGMDAYGGGGNPYLSALAAGAQQVHSGASPFADARVDRVGYEGGNLSLWGQGYYADVEGAAAIGGLGFGGEVTGFMLGADHLTDDGLLLGLALSQAASDVDWKFRDFRGKHETELLGVHPYIGKRWDSGLVVHASLGLEEGDMSLIESERPEEAMSPDMKHYSLSLGVRVPFAEGSGDGGGQTQYGIIAETLHSWAQVDSDLAPNVSAGWLRAGLQLARTVDTGGGLFSNTAEVTLRQDYGDVLEGVSIEVAGGMAYDFQAGLRLDVHGRYLMVAPKDVEEWGLSGSLAWSRELRGRGFTLALVPAWGLNGSLRQSLWEGQVDQARESAGLSYRAEVKYGILVYEALLTDGAVDHSAFVRYERRF